MMPGVKNAKEYHAKNKRGLEHLPYDFLQTNFPVNHLISVNLKALFSFDAFY